jgi:hypothetical protein
MNEIKDKYQLWGTFSVMDHAREGAFLAEVVMYDRLVIPVPPDPEHAKTPKDRNFAEKQWDRWERHGWNPKRQQTLLSILKPVAVPIEWNRERHERWAAEYEKSKRDAAQQFSEILAGWKTGEVLLDELPAMAGGVVAVSPYDSLEDLKRELGITEMSTLVERLQAGRGLPGNVISAVIGREFLVPEDPDRDEFYLLRRAVDLVQEVDYRQARADFHSAQQRFINSGKTDLESVTAAVNAMAEHLDVLQRLARRQRIWNGIRRAFFFTQIATDLLTAPINPVSAGKAAIALGKFTVDERLRNPAAPHSVRPGGALLLDAQRRLNLTLEP